MDQAYKEALHVLCDRLLDLGHEEQAVARLRTEPFPSGLPFFKSRGGRFVPHPGGCEATERWHEFVAGAWSSAILSGDELTQDLLAQTFPMGDIIWLHFNDLSLGAWSNRISLGTQSRAELDFRVIYAIRWGHHPRTGSVGRGNRKTFQCALEDLQAGMLLLPPTRWDYDYSRVTPGDEAPHRAAMWMLEELSRFRIGLDHQRVIDQDGTP